MSDSEQTCDKPQQEEAKCSTSSMLSKLEGSTRLPDKMMRILLSKEAPDAIWWLPKGDSFAIQKEKFQGEILMKYFRGNKFKSLVRNMHRWGFRRMTYDGDNTGKTVAFSHPYFRQDDPELVAQIEMTNEIKEKKPEAKKKSSLKRGFDALMGNEDSKAKKLARSRDEPPRKNASSSLPSDNLSAAIPGYSLAQQSREGQLKSEQPGEQRGVAQQLGSTQPSMQDFARNSMLLQLDERFSGVPNAMPRAALAGMDPMMLDMLRVPGRIGPATITNSPIDPAILRSLMSSQLQQRESTQAALQNEGFMLQLLASQQRNLARSALGQMEASIQDQNMARSQAGLGTLLSGSARNPLLAAEQPNQRQLHVGLQQSLVQNQIQSQLNDSILQGRSNMGTTGLLPRNWNQHAATNSRNQQAQHDATTKDGQKPAGS